MDECAMIYRGAGHAIAQPTTQLPELTMEPVFQSIVHAEAPAYLDAQPPLLWMECNGGKWTRT